MYDLMALMVNLDAGVMVAYCCRVVVWLAYRTRRVEVVISWWRKGRTTWRKGRTTWRKGNRRRKNSS
jgi:hypothetical protein